MCRDETLLVFCLEVFVGVFVCFCVFVGFFGLVLVFWSGLSLYKDDLCIPHTWRLTRAKKQQALQVVMGKDSLIRRWAPCVRCAQVIFAKGETLQIQKHRTQQQKTKKTPKTLQTAHKPTEEELQSFCSVHHGETR